MYGAHFPGSLHVSVFCSNLDILGNILNQLKIFVAYLLSNLTILGSLFLLQREAFGATPQRVSVGHAHSYQE